MSAEVQPLGQSAENARRKLQPWQMVAMGRVLECKRTEKGFYTVVQSPALDAYSFPGIHEIQSKKQLGRPGDDVQVLLQASGFRGRSFQDKHGDNQPGMVRNTLIAVED